MDGALENLEREVDAGLARLSACLSVQPAAAVVERVKQAVGHELNEQWLADQAVPVPAQQALARVRAAVRRELACSRAALGPPAGSVAAARLSAWSLPLATLAAAAMILVCVGVIRHVGLVGATVPAGKDSPHDAVNIYVQAAQQQIDLFVVAANDVLTPDVSVSTVRMDLEAMEGRATPSWPALDADDQALQEIEKRIDELFVEAQPWET